MPIEQKIKIQRIAGAGLFVLSTIITILFFSLADPLNYRFFYQEIQVTFLEWLSLCYFIGTLLLLVKHYRYSDKYWMNTIHLSHSQPLSYLVRLTTELVCRQP